jgi:L-threonylcarbamoyladenylate synthase
MNSKFLYWEKQSTIDTLIQSMYREDVCVTTTDTVLGLLAPVTAQGFNRLNEIKLRSEKSYLVVIDSIRKVNGLVEGGVSAQVEMLMQKCWPGPLTLIFKASPALPEYAKSVQGTIALRIPNHEGLRSVASEFDGLFSTSANISGSPVPTTIADLDPRILREVAYVVSSEVEQPRGKASTILDCSKEVITVVREGAYPINELEKISEQKLID